jgi:large subunit ribosomal protein L3
MTALYDPETGKRTPCTVLQLDRVQVVAHKTKRKHGYFAVQVGSGWKHKKNVTKPQLGHFSAAGVAPKRHLVEFRVMDESGLVPVGASIPADWFIEGQFIDTKSNSKGHGFTGGMKRWGFHGAGASHGTSLTHRAMGSAGQGQGGGSRVYPGKKMAGRMGNEQVTVQNVKVLQVDGEKGILVVHGEFRVVWGFTLGHNANCWDVGCVTGPKGCLVKIQDAKKKPWPQDAPKMLPLPVAQPAEGEVGEAAKVVA